MKDRIVFPEGCLTRRLCGCKRHYLPPRRKKCDECNVEAVKAHNKQVTERRKQGLLPPPVSRPKYEVPEDYPQVEVFVPWTKRPKPVLVSPEEQARIDAEARQRDAAAHQRHMAQFGMVVRKGKDLAGPVRSLPPDEISRLNYQPPQKRVGILLPYIGENME